MTALEIVVVTASLLVTGYLALSELKIDFLQQLQMKRLAAQGYARLRARRYRKQLDRRMKSEPKQK